MKPDERTELVKQLQEAEWEILETKAREYASDSDTLANFKIIADILNVTMPLGDVNKMAKSLFCAHNKLRATLLDWDLRDNQRRTITSAMDNMSEVMNLASEIPRKWTPQMVCAVYWLKHVLAILDNSARGKPLSESEFSRTLDARVYTSIMYFLNKESKNGCEES